MKHLIGLPSITVLFGHVPAYLTAADSISWTFTVVPDHSFSTAANIEVTESETIPMDMSIADAASGITEAEERETNDPGYNASELQNERSSR